MFDSLEQAIDFGKGKDNDGGIPIFRYEAVEVPHSDPVAFEDQVWVTIINRGDPKTVIERPKRKEDEKRWSAQWRAFLEGEEAPLEGIPLKEFPALTPADIMTCKKCHVRTVEELAEYPDGQIKNLGGRGYQMKKAAAKFIEYRQGPDVDELQKRIAELEKKLGDSTGDNPKRSTGNKSTKASKRNSGGSRPGRKKSTAAKHSGKKAGEEEVAGTSL